MSRLLHLYRRYYPDEGGIESTMRAFCEYAYRQGDEVTALVSSSRPWSQRAHYNGVEVVRAGSLGTIANTPLCPRMAAWIGRLKPDLIEVHHAYPYGMWALLKSRFRGPLIVHYHFDISRFGSLQRFVAPVLRDTLARADRIFVNSRSYAETSSVLSDFLDKCVYIPAGVAPTRFTPEPQVQERVAQLRRDGRFRVLFVGRLSHYKGLEHLVAAMQQVEGELNIVGRGKLALTLEQLVAMFNLTDRVRLLGRLPAEELLAQYHAADVVVLPSVSRGESFGVTQVEAMLCGRPVICSDLPGVCEVGDDRTRCLVPPANVEALAAALNRLKADANLRAQMGTAGRQRALAEYDVETLNARRYAVYQELLGAASKEAGSGTG